VHARLTHAVLASTDLARVGPKAVMTVIFKPSWSPVRAQTPCDPSSRTSSRPGSSTGSPSRRAYPNWTDEDQEALVERELHWRDRGMSEDTRVYASMLIRHNIVPEQVLFEAGCPDYQDDRAFPVLAQAAENLMRVGCDSTDDDAD